MLARANIMNLAGQYIPLGIGAAIMVLLVAAIIAGVSDEDAATLGLALFATAILLPAILCLATFRWRHVAGMSMIVVGLLWLAYSIVRWGPSVGAALISGPLVAAGVCTLMVWQREGGSLRKVLLGAMVYIKLGLAMLLWAGFAFALALMIAYPDPESTFHSRLFTLIMLSVTFFGWALFVFVAAVIDYARRP